MNKKAPLPKILYDVKLECLVPATIVYRILADSPEQALELIKGKQPKEIRYRLHLKKSLKAIVYDAGNLLIRLTKALR